MSDIGWAVATALLHLLVVGVVLTPLIWWCARRGGCSMLSPDGTPTLIVASVIYIAAHCELSLT